MVGRGRSKSSKTSTEQLMFHGEDWKGAECGRKIDKGTSKDRPRELGKTPSISSPVSIHRRTHLPIPFLFGHDQEPPYPDQHLPLDSQRHGSHHARQRASTLFRATHVTFALL